MAVAAADARQRCTGCHGRAKARGSWPFMQGSRCTARAAATPLYPAGSGWHLALPLPAGGPDPATPLWVGAATADDITGGTVAVSLSWRLRWEGGAGDGAYGANVTALLAERSLVICGAWGRVPERLAGDHYGAGEDTAATAVTTANRAGVFCTPVVIQASSDDEAVFEGRLDIGGFSHGGRHFFSVFASCHSNAGDSGGGTQGYSSERAASLPSSSITNDSMPPEWALEPLRLSRWWHCPAEANGGTADGETEVLPTPLLRLDAVMLVSPCVVADGHRVGSISGDSGNMSESGANAIAADSAGCASPEHMDVWRNATSWSVAKRVSSGQRALPFTMVEFPVTGGTSATTATAAAVADGGVLYAVPLEADEMGAAMRVHLTFSCAVNATETAVEAAPPAAVAAGAAGPVAACPAMLGDLAALALALPLHVVWKSGAFCATEAASAVSVSSTDYGSCSDYLVLDVADAKVLRDGSSGAAGETVSLIWPWRRPPLLQGASLFAAVLAGVPNATDDSASEVVKAGGSADAADAADALLMMALNVDFASCADELCPPENGRCGRPATLVSGSGDGIQVAACWCRYGRGGDRCDAVVVSPWLRALQAVALLLSNLAIAPAAAAAFAAGQPGPGVVFALNGAASAAYHACDVELCCWGIRYSTLQALDFFYSFLSAATVALCFVGAVPEAAALPAHLAAVAPLLAAAVDGPTRGVSLVVVALVCAAAVAASWARRLSHSASSSGGRGGSVGVGGGGQQLAAAAAAAAAAEGQEGFAIRLGKEEAAPASLAPVPGVCKVLLGRLGLRQQEFVRGSVLAVVGAGTFAFQRADTYWLWHSAWHISVMGSAYYFVRAQQPAGQGWEGDCGGNRGDSCEEKEGVFDDDGADDGRGLLAGSDGGADTSGGGDGGWQAHAAVEFELADTPRQWRR
ncbi:unnamed protein product [Phaeothamnion confervicola]